jgi:hypothetical protein
LECVLHIGSAKTATSALQKILHGARADLAAKGWLYPDSGLWHADRSHNGLGIYFWNDYLERWKAAPFATMLEGMLAEIQGWENIIISTEVIEKSVLSGNENLKIFVNSLIKRGYRIKVIYVVRRQDHYLDSQFKQDVSDLNVCYAGTADSFVRRHAPQLRYSAIATAWRQLPGVEEVVVLPYLERRVTETFSQILTAMGHPELLQTGQPVATINPSLEGLFLRLKHYLNGVGMSESVNRKYTRIVTRTPELRQGVEKLSLFTEDTRRQFLLQFDDDFEALKVEFDLDPTTWFAAAADLPVFTPLQSDEIENAVAAVARIDATLGNEIRAILAERRAPAKAPGTTTC